MIPTFVIANMQIALSKFYNNLTMPTHTYHAHQQRFYDSISLA